MGKLKAWLGRLIELQHMPLCHPNQRHIFSEWIVNKMSLDIRLYILTWAHGLSFVSPSTISNPPAPSKFLTTKLYYPSINRHTRHHWTTAQGCALPLSLHIYTWRLDAQVVQLHWSVILHALVSLVSHYKHACVISKISKDRPTNPTRKNHITQYEQNNHLRGEKNITQGGGHRT